MKKILFLLLSALMVALAAGAQAPGTAVVKWRTSVRMTSPTEGVVTLRAIIPEGAHLYGMTMPEGGPKATTLDFGASQGVKFTGRTSASPTPTVARDEAFGMDLQWWEGRVAFSQSFRLTAKDVAEARINVKVTYMTCNGMNCMPPRTESISAPVPPFKKK